MLGRIVSALAAALMVSACAEPVKPIQAWSPATAAAASVGVVTIVNRSPNASAEDIQALQTALEQKMAQCARGPTKYEMQVRLDNFKLANTGMVMVLGDNHEVAAEVKLVNPENNSVASEYYVQEKTHGGGLIGLAKVVAKEGAKHGVRANVICPGFVRTPLVDKQIPEQAKELGISEEDVVKKVMLKDTVDGEFTTVADVAETALFFASFESNALTGQSLIVSHGWSMQ